MLPWIQVYSNLADHPKIYALVDRMKLRRNSEAVGIVVSLWLWAAKNAPDGDLSGFPERAIAQALGFQINYAKKLCQALVDTNWLDVDAEGCYSIHNWSRYAGRLIEITLRQREQTKDRMRRYRKNALETQRKLKLENETLRVTYALTGQDITEQNQTVISHQEESSPSWSKSKLNSLFSPKLQLSESAQEELLSLTDGMEEGLLLQSLEIARDNGKLNWGYVRGILRNWQKNGVKTLGEFKEREARRKVNQSGGNSSILVPGAQDVAESRRRMEQLREELKGEGT